ncbi:MAG: cyclic nucleotide-binding domain-containing protein [Anaerolineae bacterium]|nr:cyclic nucleotide-binding domain-containing protein [Anaerolineae bacterium]
MSNQVRVFESSTDGENIAAGHVIFSQGDHGDKMYAVQSGEVDILFNGKVVETVGEGGIFGEMAIIDEAPRSAGAVARTDCKIVPVDQKRFLYMVQNTPFFAISVMRVISQRVRKLDRLSYESEQK